MFLKSTIHWIDIISEWTGRLTAWLVILIVLIIVYQATMVALFSIGSVALQELQWHLFAMIFLFGAAYTLKYDEHVRVDIIYRSHWLTDRNRAWIDLLGGIFFLIPFCLLIIVTSWPFVHNSFIYVESSPDPGGLPYRFLLKATIPLGFLLLILQGISNILKNLEYLFSKH
ncbi:MAG: TRAP transporter small permease subunit [Candidatus Marithrix sp.]|nr:TRAP transporter small permease subunit [Candidatus Marithrix sp.]